MLRTALALLLFAALPALAQQPAAQQAPAQEPPKKKFDPPRIIAIIRSADTGQAQDDGRLYYIDKGQEVNINRGDELNVYRELRLNVQLPRPMRLFIGTMTMTESQIGSAVGKFAPNANIMNQPIIKYKSPVKGDIVVPRLIIDSGVLFDPGAFTLKPGAAQEFQKVADFINNFSPGKIIIEGHTDGDGEEAANQSLSEQRAEEVRKWLIQTYNFITPGMIESRGYGENQPIVPNDTPENKQLNRRIEVVVWE